MELANLTDEELDTLRIAVLTEQERRWTLARAGDTITQLTQAVETAGGEVTPPGGTRTIDGTTWENVSGGWLSHSPAEYPQGWRDTSIILSPDVAVAWQPGLPVEVDTLVTHDGQTWRALVAHTTHAGWTPSAATYAVWEPVA